MALARHHKGMKIMVGLAFFVGEGLQTLPDKALPCPYTIFPNHARNLFSEDFLMTLARHHKGMKM